MRRRRYIVTPTRKDGRDALSAHARDAHGGQPDLEGCTLCGIFREYIRQLEIKDDLPRLAAEAQAREAQRQREIRAGKATAPPSPQEQERIAETFREARAAQVQRRAERLRRIMTGTQGLTTTGLASA